MIEFYTGVPGSGKTYRAVNYLYNVFIDKSSKDFGKHSKFFTNINDFKFSSFPAGAGADINFDELKNQLIELHNLYKTKVSDSQLIELAKKYDLDNAIFVIDECHNFFDKKDTVLVWWLSYHRHLHQDVILITQNLALIDSKYKSFSEFFYKAIPSSLRLFSNQFKYDHYIGSRMYKTERAGRIKLKFKQEVFDLYVSGANTQSKKVVLQYFFFALIAFAVLVVVVLSIPKFFSRHAPDDNSSKSLNASNSPASLSQNQVSLSGSPASSNSDQKLSNFQNSFQVLCDERYCVLNGFTFTVDQIRDMTKKYHLVLISLDHLPNHYYLYLFNSTQNFQKDYGYVFQVPITATR